MRVINVVKIKDGVVDDMQSFGVYPDNEPSDVIKSAQDMFIKSAQEIGCDEEFDPDHVGILEDGYYQNIRLNRSVCLTWSDI